MPNDSPPPFDAPPIPSPSLLTDTSEDPVLKQTCLVFNELLQTEFAYVQSLRYVIEVCVCVCAFNPSYLSRLPALYYNINFAELPS